MLKVTEAPEEAPCKKACPINIDIPYYIRLISERKFDEAFAVIREKTPFPSILSRICPAPCENECHLKKIMGEPIAINPLKRFVVEHASRNQFQGMVKTKRSSSGKHVAIIGSGPTGLTVAYYLSKLGHSVTVFEALPEPGGMLRIGISEYRLPRKVVYNEIEEIKGIGVDIKTNNKVESLDDLFKEGYNAIFLATGAHGSVEMGINGEDNPGVLKAVDFLREFNLGRGVKLGDRIAVIGGGNSAIDASRIVLRMGAKEVVILYRRTRAEMPALPKEVEAALSEGVDIQFLVAPIGISKKNEHIQLTCLRMELGERDESGRSRAIPIENSDFTMEFDNVLSAIGEKPEVPTEWGLKIGRKNTVEVNSESLLTSKVGVFAGGDVARGPASVVEAIAMGRKGASSIDKYLGGDGVIDEKFASTEEKVKPLLAGLPVGFRISSPELPVVERIKGFAEVGTTFTESAAIEEAKRCLRCDLPIIVDGTICTGCMVCQNICSLKFTGNSFNVSESAIRLKRTEHGTNEIYFTDKCDHCNLCARYCSYGSLTLGNPFPE